MPLRHLTDEEIQAYLEGKLDHRAGLIKLHLESCDSCRYRIEEYRLVFEALSEDNMPSLSPDFPDRVMAALAKEPVTKPAGVFNSWLLLAAASILAVGLIAMHFLVGWQWLMTFSRNVSASLLSFKNSLIGSTGTLPAILGNNLSVLLACGLALILIVCLDYLLRHGKLRGTHTISI